jgi:predicted 3-demethylubiquinone-9 3-methyltransferase (glyoxalase superfamily)
VSVFPNSRVTDVTYYPEGGPGPAGNVLTVNFELDGQEYTAINGGPQFTFDEAVSLLVNCADQEEIDYYWDALTAGGGEESMCGWLKDKYGFSWQICPTGWEKMLTSSDREAVTRTMDAMYKMRKLDIATLQAAFDGKET